MLVKYEKTNQVNEALQFTDEQLRTIEEAFSAPWKIDGEVWPFSWHLEFSFDKDDIQKCYSLVEISVLGKKIIGGRLDVNNPKIEGSLDFFLVSIHAEVGIDFAKREIYLKGRGEALGKSIDLNVTILQF